MQPARPAHAAGEDVLLLELRVVCKPNDEDVSLLELNVVCTPNIEVVSLLEMRDGDCWQMCGATAMCLRA